MSDQIPSLDELLQKAAADALADLDVGSIVKTAVSDAIEKAVADSFSWSGAAYKALHSRIDEVLVPSIERYDFGDYALKLDGVLSELAQSPALMQNKTVLDNFRSLFTLPVPSTIDPATLFDVYCDYAGHTVSGTGREIEFDSSEPTYAPVTCVMDFEDTTPSSYGSYRDGYECGILSFRVEDADEEDRERTRRAIEVFRWNSTPSDNKWYIRPVPQNPAKLFSLAHMSSFDVFIERVHREGCVIADKPLYETCEVELDDKPEATYE